MVSTMTRQNNTAPFAPPLLSAREAPAFTLYNAEAQKPLLIISDHAGRRVPEKLGNLGLDMKHFEEHIAYDIGAGAITRCLADRLDVRAVIAGYSRLVIDLNRQPGDPDSSPAISDNIPVPGNADISDIEAAARIDELYTPYHAAIDREIAALWKLHGVPPVLFSIHSFTPSMNGKDRFWDIGVLWNKDSRMAEPLIKNLSAWDGLHIGDNEPYSGSDTAHTIDCHGTTAGLATCAIEVRQDHCATPEEASHWADILADGLSQILTLDDLHQIRHY